MKRQRFHAFAPTGVGLLDRDRVEGAETALHHLEIGSYGEHILVEPINYPKSDRNKSEKKWSP